MKNIILFLRKRITGKSKWLSWVCDKTGGHEPGPDWGYAGGGMMDRWCKWCDGIFQSPVLENDISENQKDFMDIIGSGSVGIPLPPGLDENGLTNAQQR